MRRRAAILLVMAACGRAPEPPVTSPETSERSSGEDPSLFPLMPEPKPGEWLYHFADQERHQTFDEYQKEVRNVRSAERAVIYIQPLGMARDRWAGVLEKMREYAGIFFGTEVKVLEPLAMWPTALDAERKQYDSDLMIRYLVRRRPEDALAYVGFTDSDLFAQSLNFVFGSASLNNRCGVYSLVRLEDRDGPRFLRRSIALMTHETGHILGIPHCVRFLCNMNGSNSLFESDGRPIYLCPNDLLKLQWNMKFDILGRTEKLLRFYEVHGLAADAAWCRRRLEFLKQ